MTKYQRILQRRIYIAQKIPSLYFYLSYKQKTGGVQDERLLQVHLCICVTFYFHVSQKENGKQQLKLFAGRKYYKIASVLFFFTSLVSETEKERGKEG